MSAAQALVIDQGGHASRALVFDAAGEIVGRAECAIDTVRHGVDRVEHEAEAVLRSVREAIDRVVVEPGVELTAIDAAALACQRASVLAWDRRSGAALSPVLSWQDTRGAALGPPPGFDADAFQRCTGLRYNAHLGASKLAWLARHSEPVQSAMQQGRLCWGPLASFLLARLCIDAPYRCSLSIAQRSGLLALSPPGWQRGLCAGWDIDAEALPRLAADCALHGLIEVGGRRVPLQLCAGDQNLLPAAFGPALHRAVVINLGTGGFALHGAAVDPQRPTRLLRSLLPAPAGATSIAVEGTVNGVGAAFDWLAAERGWREPPWPLLDAPAASPPLFLNRVGGLGSPFWQAGGGSAFDRAPADDAAAMQAVAESIGFLLQANLAAMTALALPIEQVVLSGGLSRSDGFCQRLADVLQRPVQRSVCSELTARGAWALLQGHAVDAPDTDRSFEPAPDADLVERSLRWRQAMGLDSEWP